jgi:hypothetical protein
MLSIVFILQYIIYLGVSHSCSAPGHVGTYFTDACERRCVCTEVLPGMFSHECYRVREEWGCMASARRRRYIDTYKAVSTPGNPQYEQFRQITLRHASGFGSIHSPQYFLPWHQAMQEELEDILQRENCAVTIPWWRWSRYSSGWQAKTPFGPSSLTAMGTDSNGVWTTDGAFDTNLWNTPDHGCLRSDFSLSSMPSLSQVSAALSTPAGSYSAFSAALEGVHNIPHVRIGGTMVMTHSPASPTFALHHAYIDRVWDQWQQKSVAHLSAYDFDPVITMPYTLGAAPQDVHSLDASRIMYVI